MKTVVFDCIRSGLQRMKNCDMMLGRYLSDILCSGNEDIKMKAKELLNRHRDFILYGIFGVLTTVVNMAVYWLCAHPFGIAVLPSTLIAWFMAVLFAYLTNRKWVFHSEASTRQEIRKEIISFYSCRIATGIVDWAMMFVCVDLLGFNDMIIKILANVAVIILNYVASKLVIFKKK